MMRMGVSAKSVWAIPAEVYYQLETRGDDGCQARLDIGSNEEGNDHLSAVLLQVGGDAADKAPVGALPVKACVPYPGIPEAGGVKVAAAVGENVHLLAALPKQRGESGELPLGAAHP